MSAVDSEGEYPSVAEEGLIYSDEEMRENKPFDSVPGVRRQVHPCHLVPSLSWRKRLALVSVPLIALTRV